MDAQFLDPCDMRVVEDSGTRPRYELLRPMTFYSAVAEREVTVPAGFDTDGCSVPAILAPLVGSVSVGIRAGVVHDWLCKSREVPRPIADRLFLEALRCCGVDEASATTMYWAVASYTNAITARVDPTEPGSG